MIDAFSGQGFSKKKYVFQCSHLKSHQTHEWWEKIKISKIYFRKGGSKTLSFLGENVALPTAVPTTVVLSMMVRLLWCFADSDDDGLLGSPAGLG